MSLSQQVTELGVKSKSFNFFSPLLCHLSIHTLRSELPGHIPQPLFPEPLPYPWGTVKDQNADPNSQGAQESPSPFSLISILSLHIPHPQNS